MTEIGSTEGSLIGKDIRPSTKNKTSILQKFRNVLKGGRNTVIAGAVTAGAVGGGTIEATSHPVQNTVEDIASDIKHNVEAGSRNIDGKFLTRTENGNFIITDLPQIEKITISPATDATSLYHMEGNVLFQRSPRANSDEVKLQPNEVTATHAVRVAGASYSSAYDFGRFEVNHEGRTDGIGLWFMLTNEQGAPVDPSENLLKDNERPYFASGNFVDVIQVKPEETPVQSGQ